MTKIDNIISIIMVFVAAFSYASSVGYGPVATLLAVAAGIILYELIVSVANSNPSIRTMLYVTVGFIFGLTLTMVLRFNKGWLSAFICVLCMGYKYFVAEAVVSKRSKSKNLFVIIVNAFFYATMFTVIECMLFSDRSVLFILLYIVSFAFFMCCYIIYKNVDRTDDFRSYAEEPESNTVKVNPSHTVSGDWQHILMRSRNYSRIIGENLGNSMENAAKSLDKLVDVIKRKVGATDKGNKDHREYVEIKRALLDRKKQIENLYDNEDLTDNELDVLKEILEKYRALVSDFNSDKGINYLECEAGISELTNRLEMLKNTINVRRMRDKEDEAAAFTGNKRSQAQQARRKREREERERKKRQQEREEAERNRWQQEQEEANRRASQEREEQERAERERREREEAKKSYWEKFNEEREAEKRRQEEKQRREEEQRREEQERQERRKQEKQNSSSGSVEDSKYFKGCTTVEELSFRYKKLCLIYHPDNMNGNADTYIELKDEYEKLKKRLKNSV